MHTSRLFLLLLCATIMAAAVARADTVVVAPVDQDAWLEQLQPGSNHGGDTELSLHTNLLLLSMRGVARFDLSSIPPGAKIRSAVVAFDVTAADFTGNAIEVHRVTTPWTEGGATWNNLAGSYAASASGKFKATPAGPASADITSLVQDWVDGVSPNYGVMLIPTSLSVTSRVASREWPTPSQRPVLTITVISESDIALGMSVDNATPDEGNAVTYTISVSNLGPDAAGALEVTDALPKGLTFQSAAPSPGTYDSATGAWTIGALAPAGAAVLTLTATVDNGFGGARIKNTAAVTNLDELDPVAGNDVASVDVDVRFPGFRVVTGVYVGTGAGPVTVDNVGFPPDLVLIRSATSTFTVACTPSMGTDAAKLLGTNTALTANLVKSLDVDGFTVGTASEVNQLGISYYWTAFQAAPGEMAQGSYVGDAIDDRAITAPGFQPAYVIVMAASAEHAIERFSTQAFDNSTQLNGDNNKTDRIQDAVALGFQVGKHSSVNQAGVDYHYVAFAAIPGLAAQNTFLGDGLDNVNVTGLGFDPDVVILKNVDDNVSTGLRTRLVTGDNTFPVDAAPPFANGIQSLIADGFQVGNDDRTNKSGKNHHWVAFRDAPLADLALTLTVDNTIPNEGDVIAYTLAVANTGPDSATTVEVSAPLPADLTYLSALPGSGVYDDVTGMWKVASIAAGGSASLVVTARVDAGTNGRVITHTATIVSLDQNDPDDGERAASASVTVQSADVAVDVSVDDGVPAEGDTVTFNVVVKNAGPHATSGIVARDVLPAGLTYITNTATQGGYNSVSGRWDVGTLAPGSAASMGLRARVDFGTAGTLIYDTADVVGADAADPDTTNQSASAGVKATPGQVESDLAITALVSDPTPNEGQTVGYVVLVNNTGPFDATGVRARDVIPAGLSYLANTPSQGTYDDASGLWHVGNVSAGGSATLVISARVDAGTAGLTIADTASVDTLDQVDPVAANDTSTVDLRVQRIDLALAAWVDDATPFEGDTVSFDVRIVNAGPDGATGVRVLDAVPAGLAHVGATPTHGTYDDATGVWNIGAIAALDSASLGIVAVVNNGTAGDRIDNTARVIASDQADPVPGNDTATATVNVVLVEEVLVDALALPEAAPAPGDSGVVMLRARVRNNTLQPVTLDSLTIANATAGPGTQAALDAEMSRVVLYSDDGNGAVDAWDVALATAAFASGSATFAALGAQVLPSGTQHLLVVCDVDSSCARDGDSLAVAIAAPGALSFTSAPTVTGAFPVATTPAFVVDGMTAAQIHVTERTDSLVITAPTGNLVLDFKLPANGYQPDTLESLTIANLGTATDEQVARYRLIADGGNGVFDAGVGDDTVLGVFALVSSRVYELDAMALPLDQVCDDGTRLFVVCDLDPARSSGASVQIAIPVLGVSVTSTNDGPVDRAAAATSIQFIPAPDELTVFPYSVGDKRVYPGSTDVLNFGLGFYNGFDNAVALQNMRLFQQGTALGSEITRVAAYADADTNGLFSLAGDTLLATASSSPPFYDFDDVDIVLQPQRITYVFFAYDVSLLGARDSVSVNLQLGGSGDLTFASTIVVNGEFPVNSPGVDVIDGIVAAQIDLRPVANDRVAPGDSDVPMMAFTLPSNGASADVLNFVTVSNLGTALTGVDITGLTLWKEGGGDPERFDAGEDVALAPLSWVGTGWRNAAALGESLPVSRLRCYVSATFEDSATNDRTFVPYIPRGGIQVASGNDGPVDVAIVSPDTFTISTDPLITSIDLDHTSYSVGQTMVVAMRIRNEGPTTMTGVAPTPLSADGTAGATPLSGPVPAAVDVAARSDTTVVWSFTASSAGEVRFYGAASNGVESSVSTCTRTASIQGRPEGVSLTLSDVAPPEVDRGQSNNQMIRVRVDYDNADSSLASIVVPGLVVGITDAASADVAPNSALSSMTVLSSSGSNFSYTLVDSSASPLHLDFAPPLVVAPGGSVTLTLHADIAAAAALDPFRLAVAALGDVRVEDVNDAQAVVPATSHSFPWNTKAIAVALPAETLLVVTQPESTVLANAGQSGVHVFHLQFRNAGPAAAANEILSSLAFDFHDTAGAALAPAHAIERLAVISGGTTLFLTGSLPSSQSHLYCDLTTDLLLPPLVPVDVVVRVDVRAFPDAPGFYMTLGAPSDVGARDNNSGEVVDVVRADSAPFPVRSTRVVLQEPATGLAVEATSRAPAAALPATSGIAVMDLAFTHPDTAGASVGLDSLAIAFTHASGAALFPGDYFSRLRIVRGADTLATVTSLSVASPLVECRLAPRVAVAPGAAEELTILVDTRAVYAPATFRARVERDYVFARDVNSSERILGISGAFPLLSGPCRLQIPGDAVECGVASLLPANIPGNAAGLAAFDVTVRNGAPAGYTGCELRALTVGIESWKGAVLAPSRLVGASRLMAGDSVVATGTVGPSTIAFAMPAGAVAVDAGEARTLRVVTDLHAPGGETFRFVLRDTTSARVVDSGTGVAVAAGTVGGTGYPLATSFTHTLAADAREAFTNYPNPFAAGRATTRVTFYLEKNSRVTLRVFTLWGAPVATLLAGVAMPAGLHQDTVWDGLTDDGDTVANGVYYLVLDVDPESGHSTSVRRKVGVVR